MKNFTIIIFQSTTFTYLTHAVEGSITAATIAQINLRKLYENLLVTRTLMKKACLGCERYANVRRVVGTIKVADPISRMLC
jgi:hypothetical protein